jgi:Flp pilus assembly pilin Flp
MHEVRGNDKQNSMYNRALQAPGVSLFREIRQRLGHLWRDQSGAALLEYTLLISILLTLVSVGIASYTLWASGMWANLTNNLSP